MAVGPTAEGQPKTIDEAMANFLVIVDPDVTRRQAFVQQAERRLAPVEGLTSSRLEVDAFSAVWASSPRAPVSHYADSESATLLLGYAMDPAGPLTAEGVARRWMGSTRPTPIPFDGYFASVAFDRGRGLVAGVDLLGLFPLYYAASKDVCIVSATPEPFRFHPLFPAALDCEGLVGLLLARAPLGGRTLLRGISRLSAAHALVWKPGTEAIEVRQYQIPVAEPGNGSAFARHVAALDGALEDAVRRHAPPGTRHGVLLSGGRDSRMWAGYLAERGEPVHTLTLGEPGDFELQCAAPVASALGATHDVVSVDAAVFPWAADLQANREHLIGGFGNVFMWGVTHPLGQLPPTVVTGHLTDAILCGKSSRADLQDFDVAFPRFAQKALAPEQLKRLLRPDVFGQTLKLTVERFRGVFENTAPTTAQRSWQFQIAHSERCHIGAVPWRLSFGSWPVLPVLDRRVLDVVGAIPAASLANRKAQDHILRKRFPQLARLPHVAANGDVAYPLLPSLADRVSRLTKRVISPRTRSVRKTSSTRNGDRRYNYRMYDFNSQGWRAIRRRAEPERARLANLFDMEELNAFVPPPDATITVRHEIFDSVGRKLLVGLMLWAREHLP